MQPWAGQKVDKVAGIEARGFILGGAVAHQVSAGFIPIRKKGKLPYKRVSIAYSLEYGLDEMEIHEDAVVRGERVIVVDDLVATGGTAEGAVKLLRQIGAEVLAACFIIDLPDLGGAERIRELDVPVRTWSVSRDTDQLDRAELRSPLLHQQSDIELADLTEASAQPIIKLGPHPGRKGLLACAELVQSMIQKTRPLIDVSLQVG